MARMNDEQVVADAERQYWQAIKDEDVEAASRLTDESCLVAGSQGVGRIGREALVAMMKAPTWTLKEFDLSDVDVHLVTPDVAVVAYKVHEELVVDGKSLSLDAADASTWLRRDGRWVCALHTESILGDPFGRDRKAPAAPKAS
jgi:uncharacterized protein (TIGR02246 family)